jgi:C4-type Zn-finger protein
MTRRKGLTDAQIVNLNRVLRRLAEDLERNKAWREADREAQRLAAEVGELADEFAEHS